MVIGIRAVLVVVPIGMPQVADVVHALVTDVGMRPMKTGRRHVLCAPGDAMGVNAHCVTDVVASLLGPVVTAPVRLTDLRCAGPSHRRDRYNDRHHNEGKRRATPRRSAIPRLACVATHMPPCSRAASKGTIAVLPGVRCVRSVF